MRRALDAYRAAHAAGASPSELVAVVVAAHERERVELETSRCRASDADIAVVEQIAKSRTLSAEETGALRRLADLARHHIVPDDLRDPVAELERVEAGR